MIERFADRGRRVVVFALEEAASLGHDHVGTEHILLGLLRGEDDIAAQVLGSLNLTRDRVRTQVARIAAPRGAVTSGEIAFTPRAKKVLQLALDEASSLSHRDVETEHILLGLVRENGGVAARVLRNANVRPDQVRIRVIPRLWRPLGERPVEAPFSERRLEARMDAPHRGSGVRSRRAQLERGTASSRSKTLAVSTYSGGSRSRISPSKTLGGLSPRQTAELILHLPGPEHG